MKCQLNHSLKVNPLQQLCTSQAYEKKEKKKKKKKKDEHKQLCGLYKPKQGPALMADEKTSICFPQLSSSFYPTLPLCGAVSDSKWEI